MNLKFLGNNPISDEFGTILKNYTKEVIRYQPKDIIDFSYQYFYCLEKNIPLIPTFETQINTEKSSKNIQNMNKKEIIKTINENPDNNNNIISDNKINKNTKTVTPNNNSEIGNEDDDNNYLEDTPMKVPISKEMEEIIKKTEKKENKKRPVSSFSGLSENDEQKQGIKDFISDLFFESEQNANEQLKNILEKK